MRNLEQAKNILSQLVSYPVHSGASNLPIIEYIGGYLASHGVEYQLLYDEAGENANLHCLPHRPGSGWRTDPFSGPYRREPLRDKNTRCDPFLLTEKNGKLYARGACDMKGFLLLPRLRT
ncbi:MAG: M20/M25/M40 family metallo-hydrolase [Saprospiraceae bacterium]